MLVLVGSTRPAKVGGVQAALAAIATVAPQFGQVEVAGLDVSGVAPAMPVGQAAIIAGARARAAALVEAVARWEPARRRPDFFVGLEGGVDPLPLDGVRRLALVSWACVTDGRRWSYGAGGTILLPAGVAAAVEAGEELGEVIDRLAGPATRGTRGAWGVLTRDLVGRQDAFRLAVLSAFAPFFNPDLYR
jgi:inosine/xanthosine triphosphatase